MKKVQVHGSSVIACLLVLGISIAQAQTQAANNNRGGAQASAEHPFSNLPKQILFLRPAGFSLMFASRKATPVAPGFSFTPMAAAGALPVTGSGLLGRLTKWTGFTSTNSVIGNSTIFEDKFGNVGIGTDSPTSRLTVAGMIASTSGGIRFPDGTIQATSATGALFSVPHDATLMGDGTAGSPLGISVPLLLRGPAMTAESFVLTVELESGGSGVLSKGGDSSDSTGGTGIFGEGGSGAELGGTGVSAKGGFSGTGEGGIGVNARGGACSFCNGGAGVNALGGGSTDSLGGAGVIASGGMSQTGNGGDGVVASPGTINGGGNAGRAGVFNGDVQVNGDFNVTGTKNFKIDHPLDPENKYLYHAAIESSEVLNIYSGNVTTNESGDATVPLPDWFEAVNRDFRYQLTVVGRFAQAIVARKIKDNRFIIKTSEPNVEVSWQVSGVRSDAALRKRVFKVEEEKPERERGYYLTPEAYGQPEERSVEWARNPEVMRQLKQRRLEAEQGRNQPKLLDR
jgi:hypothetical protein